MADKLEFILGAKDEFSKTLGKFRSGINTAAKAAGIAAAAVAGTSAALLAMTKRTAENIDELGKFSQRIGVSVEALSAYQHVAELSGVSTAALNVGLQRMTRRLAEASTGTGVAVKALEELNINIEDIEDLSPDKQFEAIAEAMQGLESQSERVAVAFKLFDTEGVALVNTMKEGRAGIEAMKQEAEALGLVISERAAASAANFNDMLTRLSGVVTGLKNLFAEEMMPILTELGNRFIEFAIKNREEFVKFGKRMLEVFRNILEKGAFAVAGLIDAWRGLQMVWEVLKIVFNEFNRILFTGLDALTEKVVSTMEALNFRGIFDDAISGAKEFQATSQDAIGFFAEEAAKAREELELLAAEPLAITRVDEFRERFNLLLEELRVAGEQEVALTEEKNAKKEQNEQSSATRIRDIWNKNKEEFSKFNANLATIAATGSKEIFALAKASSIAETIMSTWEGAQKTYTALAANPIAATVAAAAAVAAGFARVAAIQSQTLPMAHTGLTSVPSEEPFLLAKAERVVSTPQNQDLTEFLDRANNGTAGIGGTVIETLSMPILPNATSLDSLLNMGNEEWIELVETKIVPALNTLQTQGAV
jgi:hypothetical protein